jgi:3-hydroxyacyl-CoA dehydrogenase
MVESNESAKVVIERDGDVLVVTINNPPINAGSIDVRRGVLDAVTQLQADSSLVAAVLIGGGRTFIAGSDLREFGMPLEDPQLPAVISAIEACGKPVVAAIHGAALGGGYELALGCDARIASDDAVVGLPEVTLGMLPGAGGTQRLPRLVSRIEAVKQICTGERVRAKRAHALGMVDAVTPLPALRAQAVQFAAEKAQKRLVSALPLPVDVDEEFERIAADLLKKGRRRPNVAAAIEAVRSTKTLEVAEGLRRERAQFQVFRVGPDAKALRHLFFAERQAQKIPEIDDAQADAVNKIAVIGAGTMGSGIAIAALDAGFGVVLLDQQDAALVKGVERIDDHYAKRVQSGKEAQDSVSKKLADLSNTTDWSVIAETEFVIEAVFENLDAKKAVFERLSHVARPGTILASNTSYLDLDEIARATSSPKNVVGLHFFSPAQVMRLVEVVRGKATSARALKTAFFVAGRMKKLPVLTQNAFGFIGNRIYAAYRKQCEFLLEEGAYPEQVDRALEAWGFAMGPFSVGDMSGLDIAWQMRKASASSSDPAVRYVSIPDRLCEQGRYGRKTGRGYYQYPEDASRGVSDAAVHSLIDAASAEKSLARRAIDDDEIQRRAVLAMVNEAALLVAEGVARSADDVDLVLTNGYGFPRWRGGPVWYVREQGLERIREDLQWLQEKSGAGFRAGDPVAIA